MEAMRLLDTWGKVIFTFRENEAQYLYMKPERQTLFLSPLSLSSYSMKELCRRKHVFLFLWFIVWGLLEADSDEYCSSGLSEKQMWWYCSSSVLLSWGQRTSEPHFPSLLHNFLSMQTTPGILCDCYNYVFILSVWFSVLPHHHELLTSHIMSAEVFSHTYWPSYRIHFLRVPIYWGYGVYL